MIRSMPTYPQYLEGMGSFKGTHRLALGGFPVVRAAFRHSCTDLISELEGDGEDLGTSGDGKALSVGIDG